MIAEVDSAHFGRMASLYFHLVGATYRDMLETRVILEPTITDILAREQNPEHIQTLREYLGRSSPKASVAPWPVQRDEQSFEFRALLMNMSGNPVIRLLARSLQDLEIDRWAASGCRLDGYDADKSHDVDIHDTIARAIIEGRPAKAGQLMRQHIRDFIQDQFDHNPRRLEQTVSWL